MVYRYVPLLRSKAGEAIALENLSAPAKARLFPIIHLAAQVPVTFVPRLGRAWSGRALGLDGLFNFSTTGSGAAMQGVFHALTGLGIHVIPSVEYGVQAGYMAVAAPLAQAAGSGLVVKVRLGDLQSVVGWLSGAGWQPQDVDLVIAAGHISDFGAGVIDQLVLHSLQNLPQPQAWRSVTLAGSAAPKDFSVLALGQNAIPRLDWLLWQATHVGVPFHLDYGDYGIGHPDLTEPPPFVMGNATVSARYTLDNDWLFIKGRPVSGANGIPMGVQYMGHAQAFVALPAFGGLVGCWGDARIQQIVAGTSSPGGRPQWVEIGVNRHLSLVADRLP